VQHRKQHKKGKLQIFKQIGKLYVSGAVGPGQDAGEKGSRGRRIGEAM